MATETLFMRVPVSVKRTIERCAKKEGQTQTEFVVSLVEHFAARLERAEKKLKKVNNDNGTEQQS